MQYKKIENKIVFRLDKGEEIVESIKKICEEEKIKLGTVQGLGAINKATIGLFETETKKYLAEEFLGDFEVCPLSGNITNMDEKTYLHCHVNLAGKDHKSFGGHLTSATVSATFEGIIEIINGEIGRKFNDEIGLNLLHIL
jgi:hypothetical protein